MFSPTTNDAIWCDKTFVYFAILWCRHKPGTVIPSIPIYRCPPMIKIIIMSPDITATYFVDEFAVPFAGDYSLMQWNIWITHVGISSYYIIE